MGRIAFFLSVIALFSPDLQAVKETQNLYKGGQHIYQKQSHNYKKAGSMPDHRLTCHDLLQRQWAYNTARVATYCKDATKACISYHLLKKHLDEDYGDRVHRGADEADLEIAAIVMRNKLMTCQLVIDAFNSGADSLPEYVGLR